MSARSGNQVMEDGVGDPGSLQGEGFVGGSVLESLSPQEQELWTRTVQMYYGTGAMAASANGLTGRTPELLRWLGDFHQFQAEISYALRSGVTDSQYDTFLSRVVYFQEGLESLGNLPAVGERGQPSAVDASGESDSEIFEYRGEDR